MVKIGKGIIIILIKFYQLFISPILGKSKCRFYPTCSNYALSALKNRGLIKGLFLTIKRICKCHPFHAGGYDPLDKN